MFSHVFLSRAVSACLGSFCLFLSAQLAVTAQTGPDLYNHIKKFPLTGQASVNGLVLKRDRVEMTLTGTVYFASPVQGSVNGAVFVGQGTFRSAIPADAFERANVKRLIGNEGAIETDFRSAVFSFSDDTYDVLGNTKTDAAAPPDVQSIATEFNERMLKETGANIASRVVQSLLNRESPGFFLAHFDGGKRGRFSFLFDQQNRVLTDYFGINAGEKGIIFKYNTVTNGNDVWMAFHSLADYARNVVPYSSENDVVDIENYDMQIDVTDPHKRLGLKTQIRLAPRFENVRAIPFNIGENLGESYNTRLKKQMRVKAVRVNNADIGFVQEDWEAGFTVFLPESASTGKAFVVDLELEGDFLHQPQPSQHGFSTELKECSYPLSNESWYPRHGYLDRSTFSMTFRHAKRDKIASVGTRKSEVPAEDDKNIFVTRYEMNEPVALVTFALGPFKRHVETVKWDRGETPTPLEFNSLANIQIAEPLALAELSNTVRYFQLMFGKYPYETYSATFHPYGFGQGFPSMIMMPAANSTNKYVFSFVAHETAHQWWGNIVAWRSYRDQWLSEGFAEYSGIIYTNLRKDPGAGRKLIEEMRDSLRKPPITLSGTGKGKLYEVGPLIAGHRLSSHKTQQGYQTLIYSKGALVLRMLHFLMADPVSGDNQPFYDMMKDFVERHRNKTASTDDFRIVANEHFARTPNARRYQITNLDWFFQQWVYEYGMPSYQLEYQVESQPDGSTILTGNVMQENVPSEWFMVLPIVFDFGGDKFAQGTVAANGAKTPFRIKLPMKPLKVQLDPQHWVLSEKTTTK